MDENNQNVPNTDNNDQWQNVIDDFNAGIDNTTQATPAEQVAPAAQQAAPVQPQAPVMTQQPVPQAQPQYNATFDAYAPVAPVTPVKKNIVPIIIGIIAVLAIAVGAVVLFMSGIFSGGGYTNAEKEFFGGIYSAVESQKDSKTSISEELTFTPSADLIAQMGSDVTLNPTTFKMTGVQDGLNGNVYLAWLNGSKTVVDLSAWILNGEEAIVSLPTISDYIFKADVASTINGEEAKEATTTLDYDKLLENIKTVTDKYLEIAKDAPITSEDVTVGGLTAKYDKATVELTGKDAAEIAKAFIESIKTNDNALSFFAESTGSSKDELIAQLDEAVKTIDTELESGEDEFINEKLATITTYFKGNEIYGRVIEANGVEFLNYKKVVSGSSYAFDLELNFEDTVISVTDAGTEADGKNTGTFNISIKDSENTQSYSCTIDYKDLSADENGNYSGSIVISSTELGFSINMALSVEDKTQIVSFDIVVAGVNYGNVSIKSTISKDATFTAPTVDESKVVTEEDIENETGNYGEFIKEIQAYIADINSKIADENGGYDLVGLLAAQFFTISGNSYEIPDTVVTPIEPEEPDVTTAAPVITEPVDTETVDTDATDTTTTPVASQEVPEKGNNVDVSSFTFALNGSQIQYPFKADAFTSIIPEISTASVEANDFLSLNNEAYTLSMMIKNEEDTATAAKDGTCASLYVYYSSYSDEYDKVNFTVNGIGEGSTGADIIKACGEPTEYTKGDYSETYRYYDERYTKVVSFYVNIETNTIESTSIYSY